MRGPRGSVDARARSNQSGQSLRARWLSNEAAPEVVVRCFEQAGIILDTEASAGEGPAARVGWINRAPSGAKSKPDLSQARVAVLHFDAGGADALAEALRARGATAALISESEPSLRRVQMLEPDAVLTTWEDLERSRDGLTAVWAHPTLRWTPVLVASPDSIGPGGAHAPEIRDVGFALSRASVVRSRLAKAASSQDELTLSLGTLGPLMTLRALLASGRSLRVHVESDDADVEIDLAEGLVVGAQGGNLNEPPGSLLGVHALKRVLRLASGYIEVRHVEHPAVTNIMAPLEAALVQAQATPSDAPMPTPEGQPREHSQLAGTPLGEPVPESLPPEALTEDDLESEPPRSDKSKQVRVATLPPPTPVSAPPPVPRASEVPRDAVALGSPISDVEHEVRISQLGNAPAPSGPRNEPRNTPLPGSLPSPPANDTLPERPQASGKPPAPPPQAVSRSRAPSGSTALTLSTPAQAENDTEAEDAGRSSVWDLEPEPELAADDQPPVDATWRPADGPRPAPARGRARWAVGVVAAFAAAAVGLWWMGQSSGPAEGSDAPAAELKPAEPASPVSAAPATAAAEPEPEMRFDEQEAERAPPPVVPEVQSPTATLVAEPLDPKKELDETATEVEAPGAETAAAPVEAQPEPAAEEGELVAAQPQPAGADPQAEPEPQQPVAPAEPEAQEKAEPADVAIAAAEEAVEKQAREDEARQALNRARELARDKRYTEASSLFRTAMRDRKLYVRALAGLTEVHLARGEHGDALLGATSLVRQRPNRAQYHVILGDAYVGLGRPDKAQSAWQRAAELGSEQAKKRLKAAR